MSDCRRLFWLLPLLLALLAACSDLVPTGTDTADQATSAQRFLPAPAGYIRNDSASLTDALATLGGGASLLSGNPALAAAISTIDNMIQCYRDVGAVAAGIYTKVSLDTLLQGEGISLGALAVINQERLSRNFLNCALGDTPLFSAQAEHCICSGKRLAARRQRDHPLPLCSDRLPALPRLSEPLRLTVAPAGRAALSRRGG